MKYFEGPLANVGAAVNNMAHHVGEIFTTATIHTVMKPSIFSLFLQGYCFPPTKIISSMCALGTTTMDQPMSSIAAIKRL